MQLYSPGSHLPTPSLELHLVLPSRLGGWFLAALSRSGDQRAPPRGSIRDSCRSVSLVSLIPADRSHGSGGLPPPQKKTFEKVSGYMFACSRRPRPHGPFFAPVRLGLSVSWFFFYTRGVVLLGGTTRPQGPHFRGPGSSRGPPKAAPFGHF